MDTNKVFPIDIWAVKEYGIEKWIKEYSVWPIHDSDALALKKEIQNLYFKMMNVSPPEIENALLVLFKLTLEYERYIHYSIVIDRLKSAGYFIKYTGNSLYFNEILNNDSDFDNIFNQFEKRFRLKTPSYKRRFIDYGKTIRRGIVYRSKYSTLFSTGKNSLLSVIGNPSHEFKDYIEKHRKNVKHFYPYSIISKRYTLPENIEKKIEPATNILKSGLSEIASNHSISIRENHLSSFVNFTKESIIEILKRIEELKNGFKKIKATSILVPSLGSTYSRCISVAGRSAGHKVIGSIHGNNVGIALSDTIAMIDLSLVDEYIVPTKGAAQLYVTLKNKLPVLKDKKLDIVSIDTTLYKNLFEENQKKPLPSKIDTVMLIEFPLTEFRYDSIMLHWPYQLDIMIRLGNFLKEQNIKTIMKVHPDRRSESKNLYDNYFDEVVSEPFESVAEMADTYIFTHPTTTTFGYALTTNRPVFIFETSLGYVYEEPLKSLKKRCSVIPSVINEESKLIFDEDAFEKLLNSNVKKPDTEFLEKYMF